ncbi:MAG: hypothetical protein KatS3mg027_2074 [Bacteroidia bacterium]|nr:MAG: hypothetical protein KatS3mg027_2074 [Bacteroidia bacterium]
MYYTRQVVLILLFCVLTIHKIHAQTNKWAFVAINSKENKSYVINKIQATEGLKYIAFCNSHQLVIFKYDNSIFQKPSDIYNLFVSTDDKLREILIEKVNMDDEASIKEIISYCDFDGAEADILKKEIENGN